MWSVPESAHHKMHSYLLGLNKVADLVESALLLLQLLDDSDVRLTLTMTKIDSRELASGEGGRAFRFEETREIINISAVVGAKVDTRPRSKLSLICVE